MPRNGDLRFMIYPDGKVTAFAFNNNSSFQKDCLKVGNCFKTRSSATRMAVRFSEIIKKGN